MGVGGGRGNGIREVRICEASPCRGGRVRIRRGGLVGRMGISVVLGCGMSCSRRGRGGHDGRSNSGRHTNSAGRGRDEKGFGPQADDGWWEDTQEAVGEFGSASSPGNAPRGRWSG